MIEPYACGLSRTRPKWLLLYLSLLGLERVGLLDLPYGLPTLWWGGSSTSDGNLPRYSSKWASFPFHVLILLRSSLVLVSESKQTSFSNNVLNNILNIHIFVGIVAIAPVKTTLHKYIHSYTFLNRLWWSNLLIFKLWIDVFLLNMLLRSVQGV